jgi:NADH-quinone oxidoreductase subunit M
VFFFSEYHILATVLFTPLLGAFVLLFIPRERAGLHRQIANAFGFLGLAISLPLLWKFKSGSSEPFQFVADANWIPSLGVHFRLGIDGLSLVMIILTTVLGAVAISLSWSAIQKREKEYYVLLLLLQTGMLGVFMSLDFVLFYVFWEVMLVPMYLLIGVWGTENRVNAALKFFLYTIAGSAVMLFAILGVYQARGTFDVREILLHPFTAQAGHLEYWLFWGFFFAFAIKVPMFPFHTWLADACTEAPTAASVILAGVLLKTGTYGFLRFSVPMFPDAALKYRSLLIILSLVAIVYGALICVTQKDMKRMIAYSSVSQMGLCTLGIFALTPLGLYGSIIQQLSHGIVIAALLLIVGILYERRDTRLISEFGGLATPMPRFAAVYLVATLASLGIPLLSGFIGEFTVLRGVFEVRWPWVAWALLGALLVAVGLLWMYQRVVLGSVTNPANEHLVDLNTRDLATLIPLILLSLCIGLYSAPIFRVLKQPVEKIVNAVHPGYYSAARILEPVQPRPSSMLTPATSGSAPEAR